jgi:hypothetical protein
MIPHFYVFGYGMENWLLCYTYGTSAVTLKWDMGILLTKVTHGVCDPKELRTTTSCGHILCLDSGLSNTQLFAGVGEGSFTIVVEVVGTFSTVGTTPPSSSSPCSCSSS